MLKKSYLSVPFIDNKSLNYAYVGINATIVDDIDNNGFIDIVTFPSNYVYDVPLSAVVWSNKNSIFTPDSSLIKNAIPYQFFRDSVAGDFNKDGYTDYFQVDQGWELNNRDPNFFYGANPTLLLGGPKGLTAVPVEKWMTNPGGSKAFNHIGAAADYDRDGDTDVLVAAVHDFRIYQNNNDGTFTWREDLFHTKFNANDGIWNISGSTFIDLNGQYAIVAGTYRTWWINGPTMPLNVLVQKDGKFVESYFLPRPDLGLGRERNYGATDMFNIDVNGDGREDLIVVWETDTRIGINDGLSNMSGKDRESRYTDLGNSVINVYFQDSSGRLVPEKTFYNGPDTTSGMPLYLEDFNLDGYVDFWMGSFHGKPGQLDNLIYINDGTGHFNHPKNMFPLSETFPDWYELSPYFFDANNDGAIDVVATRAIFPEPPTRTIGQEIRTFLSDRPTYDINGNNKFLAVLKDKTWDGGGGVDTAVFSGAFQDYKVSRNDQGQLTFTDKIAGRDGVDSFVNVERFKFDNGTIALDWGGTAGYAYRLYTAALDRAPDAQGLGYWISALDRGAMLKTVSQGFVDSTEFRANFYGDGSNAAFVTAMYRNVLDRAPDMDGFNFWTGALARGVDRAEVLIGFSESPENQANALQLTGGAVVYQEWML